MSQLFLCSDFILHRISIRFILYTIIIFVEISCAGSPRYLKNEKVSSVRVSSKNQINHSNTQLTHKKKHTHTPQANTIQTKGKASYYAAKFHGRKTASGEIFNQEKLTGAHNTLPFGTMVRVTNCTNNRTVVVRINDRGPYKSDRIIDVSHAAAKQLGMIQQGVVPVIIKIISSPPH